MRPSRSALGCVALLLFALRLAASKGIYQADTDLLHTGNGAGVSLLNGFLDVTQKPFRYARPWRICGGVGWQILLWAHE